MASEATAHISQLVRAELSCFYRGKQKRNKPITTWKKWSKNNNVSIIVLNSSQTCSSRVCGSINDHLIPHIMMDWPLFGRMAEEQQLCLFVFPYVAAVRTCALKRNCSLLNSGSFREEEEEAPLKLQAIILPPRRSGWRQPNKRLLLLPPTKFNLKMLAAVFLGVEVVVHCISCHPSNYHPS
jgi:hypothetical protein